MCGAAKTLCLSGMGWFSCFHLSHHAGDWWLMAMIPSAASYQEGLRHPSQVSHSEQPCPSSFGSTGCSCRADRPVSCRLCCRSHVLSLCACSAYLFDCFLDLVHGDDVNKRPQLRLASQLVNDRKGCLEARQSSAVGFCRGSGGAFCDHPKPCDITSDVEFASRQA